MAVSEHAREFRLKYVGIRFSEARLPLDVILDLPAFRDLIAAFAKARWRADNADRKRLPKGFDQSISFDLLRIEEGSAVPAIAWSRSIAQRGLPGFSEAIEDLVDGAYEDAIKLIDSAADGLTFSTLPPGALYALNKLGSGLREDERIEFVGSRGRHNNVVSFDAEKRRRLLRSTRQPYRMRTSGVGRLFGLNVDAGFIDVEIPEYGDVRINVDANEVKNVYDGNADGRVQYDLLVELDHEDRFRTVVETYDLNLIDEHESSLLAKLGDRLRSFKELDDGWNNGEGGPISRAAVDAAGLLMTKRSGLADKFLLYPTLSGGVQIELETAKSDLIIEFKKAGGIELSGIDLSNDQDIDLRSFDAVNEDFLRSLDNLAGFG